ncbi:MAG: conjugal transfer protein TraB [Desulfobacteraceae bacterium]|jgi:hypothetical protein
MLNKEDELALKVTKEIVIKFIEVGRLSLGSFDEAFTRIHETVRGSLLGVDLEEDEEKSGD